MSGKGLSFPLLNKRGKWRKSSKAKTETKEIIEKNRGRQPQDIKCLKHQNFSRKNKTKQKLRQTTTKTRKERIRML